MLLGVFNMLDKIKAFIKSLGYTIKDVDNSLVTHLTDDQLEALVLR